MKSIVKLSCVLLLLVGCKKTGNPNAFGITLVSPLNGAINQPIQPIFVWKNVNPIIKSFAIYYGTNANSLIQDTKNYINITNTSDTIRVSPDGSSSPYLSYDTTYYWTVVGKSADSSVVYTAPIQRFTSRKAIYMPTARQGMGLAVYNNKIYAVGGSTGSSFVGTSPPLSTVEIWDGNAWTTGEPMLTARSGLGLAVYNNNLYAMGGNIGSYITNPPLSTVEIWNGTNWTTGTPMPTPRYGLGLATYNNNLYAVGGYNKGPLSTVEIWNGTNWTTGTSLSTARYLLGLATYNNTLFAVGGINGTSSLNLSNVEAFNGNAWGGGTPLNVSRGALSLASYNNNLYVIGGYNSSTLSTVEIWNGVSWKIGAAMPTPRYNFGLVVYNNMLYAIGGYGSTGVLSIVEIFNPATDQWQ